MRPARARLALLAVAALAPVGLAATACTAEQPVLVAGTDAAPDAVIDAAPEVGSCSEAWTSSSGASCAAGIDCQRLAPDDPQCCIETAACTAGALARTRTCDPLCHPCADDLDCKWGAAMCIGDLCIACPDDNCSPCPGDWVPLRRNGCPSCDCAPPSECSITEPCLDASDYCYEGASCAPGCVDGDPGCCANACSSYFPLCAGPAPVGCLMPCSSPGGGCDYCMSEQCECEDGTWVCTDICLPGEQASCVVP